MRAFIPLIIVTAIVAVIVGTAIVVGQDGGDGMAATPCPDAVTDCPELCTQYREEDCYATPSGKCEELKGRLKNEYNIKKPWNKCEC